MQGEACLDSPQPKRAGSPGRSCGKPVTAECPRRRRCWSDSPPRPHVCGRHWCAVHTTFSEQVSLTPLAGEETGSLRPNGPSHPAPARKPRVAPACLALGSSSESAEWFPSPLVLEKAEEQLASPGGEVFSKRIQEKAGLREEENTARYGGEGVRVVGGERPCCVTGLFTGRVDASGSAVGPPCDPDTVKPSEVVRLVAPIAAFLPPLGVSGCTPQADREPSS
ncbi:hypothetical protein H920_16027 [Fukomys damarensis]|uniref:Uncharacterized protein n=1 Tax=Fukomys damarensis TaxID=885580 RepID=A0A091CVH0_FUKDA|nr:hypothetical protein H920_16027 [Fukomys damarensis]